MQRRNKFTRTTAQKGTSKNSAKNKLKVSEKCPRQFSNVKARVLWRDWLICDITRAAREYKRNTKGKRKKKNCYFKFKNEREFLHLPPSIGLPLKGVLLFLKKLMDFSSSNFSCDSLCQVFASGLAGTCYLPPTSNGNNFCKGFYRRFLLPLLHALSTVAPPTKPLFLGCTSAILSRFQVLRFDFPSSISVTISPGATDCATLAPSLASLWCSLRSTKYSRFQRFQNWPSNSDK